MKFERYSPPVELGAMPTPRIGEEHRNADLPVGDIPEIGMSNKEREEYSLLRLVEAQLTGDWSKAGLERDASHAVAKLLGRRPGGDFVPFEVMGLGQRDVNSGAGSGGSLIGTELRPSSFVEMMRNESIVSAMGATMLPGLVGNVDLPRQLTGSSGTWIDSEGTDVTTSSSPTFDSVPLRAKTLRARVDLTRRMIKQSTPSIEGLIKQDLAAQFGEAIDMAAINGDGGDEPTGIIGATGTSEVVIGENGGALTWDHLVNMTTTLGNHKRLGNLGFVTSSGVIGQMKKTPRHATAAVMGFLYESGQCADYPVHESNSVPQDGSKGTGSDLHTIVFGAWPALLVGLWGGLDIEADRNGENGQVILRAFQDADTALRYPGAFSYCDEVDLT